MFYKRGHMAGCISITGNGWMQSGQMMVTVSLVREERRMACFAYFRSMA